MNPQLLAKMQAALAAKKKMAMLQGMPPQGMPPVGMPSAMPTSVSTPTAPVAAHKKGGMNAGLAAYLAKKKGGK